MKKYLILPGNIKILTDTFFRLNGTVKINNRLVYCQKIEQLNKEINYIFGYR